MTKREITQLSYAITGCAIKVHKALGPGLLESIYEKCLKYDDLQINTNLKLDLFVNDLVVIELKTVEAILPVHEAQLPTYMKLLEAPQGLLFNFFTDNIVRSMKPFVNDYFRILAD